MAPVRSLDLSLVERLSPGRTLSDPGFETAPVIDSGIPRPGIGWASILTVVTVTVKVFKDDLAEVTPLRVDLALI